MRSWSTSCAGRFESSFDITMTPLRSQRLEIRNEVLVRTVELMVANGLCMQTCALFGFALP